jgi:inosose dehydratase
MIRSSRRQWLQGAAGFALAGTTAASLRGREDSSGCPMGFGTYGLPGYSLEDAIQLVADTGFDSIEFASMPGYHGAPDQITASKRKGIRSRIADSGLELGALMGLPFPDEKKTADNKAWVEQMLELAIDLAPENGSPPIIQSVLGGGEWEQKKTLFRDSLGPWLELAKTAGVQLSIKPHRGHAMSRPEQGVWLIEQLDAAGQLTLVYDYSHFIFRDLVLAETVKIALPHTGYIVVKDAVQLDGKVRFQLPGESKAMPHARILKMFHDGGYRGEVCCEVSSQVWKADGYDARTATQFCHTNLVDMYSAAGLER